MAKKITTRVFSYLVVGGILGGFIGFLYRQNLLPLGGVFKYSPNKVMTIGTILGIFTGAVIGSLINYIQKDKTIEKKDSSINQSKLHLKEEQLDITKRRVKTAVVTVHKEIIKEEKNITVPVTREELVIEKEVLDKADPSKTNERTETIRIPIKEELIEIIKHPVAQEDVKIYKEQTSEIQHVQELLAKEKLHIKTTGNPKIINKED